jgi:alkylhydroperoxidase family enzyme
MSRIEPMVAPYPPEVHAQLARMMPAGAEPIGLFRLFVRNLPMAQAMSGWGGYELSRQLSLSMRDREIVIDRTCARTGCEYEWGVHIQVFADRVGLTADQVTSLTHGGPSDEGWTERERLLITAVDELHDTNDISDPLWSALVGVGFADVELLDLLLLTGWYHAISYVARATRIPLEPGAPTFASVGQAPGSV